MVGWVWLGHCLLVFTGHHSDFGPPLDTCLLVFSMFFPSFFFFFFFFFCLFVILAGGIGDILCLRDSLDH